MALAVAMGSRPEELDLGGKQELAGLAGGRRMGLDWVLWPHNDQDVQAGPVEKVIWFLFFFFFLT